MHCTALDDVKEINCEEIIDKGMSCYNALFKLVSTEMKTQDIAGQCFCVFVCVCLYKTYKKRLTTISQTFELLEELKQV